MGSSSKTSTPRFNRGPEGMWIENNPVKKYPTFEEDYQTNINDYMKRQLIRDDALVQNGWQYYEGDVKTAQEMRDAGWTQWGNTPENERWGGLSEAEARNRANSWYRRVGGPGKGSQGGVFGGGTPGTPSFSPPSMPDPTNATGMKAITGGQTLGDIGKNVFDNKPTGLKGLTTGSTDKKTVSVAPDTKRKKLSDLLGVNVGMLKPGSGIGVNV